MNLPIAEAASRTKEWRMLMRLFVTLIVVSFAWMVSRIMKEHPSTPVSLPLPKIANQAPAVAAAPATVSEDNVERTSIRIGWNNNPPRKFWTADKADGLAMPLLREALDRAHLVPQFVACDLPTCMQWIREQKIDAVVETMKNPERESFLDYIDPQLAVSIDKVFYSVHSRPIRQISDLQGLRLGNVGPSWPFSLPSPRSYATPQQMLLSLGKGEIDAAFAPEDLTDFLVARKGLIVNKSELRQNESMLVHLIAIGKNSSLQAHKDTIRQNIEELVLAEKVSVSSSQPTPTSPKKL